MAILNNSMATLNNSMATLTNSMATLTNSMSILHVHLNVIVIFAVIKLHICSHLRRVPIYFPIYF